jgi:CopG family nickel-responsive transcriptional regulator
MLKGVSAAQEALPGMVRVTVSLPGHLVARLDGAVRRKGYANRSNAVADMLSAQLVEHHREEPGEEIVGTITLVYDHHKPHLQGLLTSLQHEHGGDVILSTVHVHLDHDHCLEVLLVRGESCRVRSLADALITAKGVMHGKLTVTSTRKDLPVHSRRGIEMPR